MASVLTIQRLTIIVERRQQHRRKSRAHAHSLDPDPKTDLRRNPAADLAPPTPPVQTAVVVTDSAQQVSTAPSRTPTADASDPDVQTATTSTTIRLPWKTAVAHAPHLSNPTGPLDVATVAAAVDRAVRAVVAAAAPAATRTPTGFPLLSKKGTPGLALAT